MRLGLYEHGSVLSTEAGKEVDDKVPLPPNLVNKIGPTENKNNLLHKLKIDIVHWIEYYKLYNNSLKITGLYIVVLTILVREWEVGLLTKSFYILDFNVRVPVKK